MTRWRLTVLLLRSPERVSRRLVRMLSRWPAESRRHLILDAPESADPKTAPVPVIGSPSEPMVKKQRKPLPRGEARFSAKRWALERQAQLEVDGG